jgi:hypothetical protein
MLVNGDSKALRVVLLSSKPRYARIFLNFPTNLSMKHFLNFQRCRDIVSPVSNPLNSGPLLALPSNPRVEATHVAHLNRERTFSGCHFLKTLRFNQHLRSANKLEMAIGDAIDLAVPDQDLASKVLGARPINPSPVQIRRGRLQLDATSNNIRRRYMTNLALNFPNSVRSAHLFSDASPVTGVELQGMILHILMISNSLMEIVMPGVHLPFGQYGIAAKMRAFLWSFFLVCGPTFVVMDFWVNKIRSLTTDMGTEIRSLDSRNIMAAFLARLNGSPMDQLSSLVGSTSRLFRRALRIPGWSHPVGMR